MPRDGAMTLADVRAPSHSIVYEWCGRRVRYNAKRPIAVRGDDAKLQDLLATLAHCEKARSVNIHDRCQAKYEGL